MSTTEHQEPYRQDNIFAKILRREIPAISVYEDSCALAFMDAMPQGKGHILLIPKTPCRNILDADAEILPHLIVTAQKLARAAQKALSADGISIMQYNEEAGGQSVFHLHFHIVPRFNGIALKAHSDAFAAPAELSAQAEKIREALEHS